MNLNVFLASSGVACGGQECCFFTRPLGVDWGCILFDLRPPLPSHSARNQDNECVRADVVQVCFWFIENLPEGGGAPLFGAACLFPFSDTVCQDWGSSDGRRKFNNGTVCLNTYKQECYLNTVEMNRGMLCLNCCIAYGIVMYNKNFSGRIMQIAWNGNCDVLFWNQ